MLSYIRHNDCIILFKYFIDRFDNILSLHHAVFWFHLQRMLLFPLSDSFQPCRIVARFHILKKLFDGLLRIGDNRDIYFDISGNRRRINVNMHDLRVRCKCMQFSGNTVIKSGTDGEKEIAFTHSHIGSIGTVHSKIADKERVIGRNRTSSHNRCHHRNICDLSKFAKACIGSGNINTSARKEQRAFCFTEHLDCPLKLADMYTCARFIPTDIHSLRIFRTSQLCHHIFREIHKYRTRASCSCNIKRFFDDAPEILSPAYRHTVFGNTSCDSYNINFLKGIISDQSSGHLTGKAYQRNTVIVGCCKSCYQIRRTRAAGYKTYAYFPCRSRIGICRMNQCLFMSWKDHLCMVLLIKFIADIDRAGARISEHDLYSFFFQRFYQ